MLTSCFTEVLCSGQGGGDKANISNIAVHCGLVFGTARPLSGATSLPLNLPAGEEWYEPLYSCASASKAIIKTVTFKYNGTQSLDNLLITNVTDKIYAKEEEKPLWVVENANRSLSMYDPLWGLAHPRYENHVNISTLRKESLWLPGYSVSGLAKFQDKQNIPGVTFHLASFAKAYDLSGFGASEYDYSGTADFSVYRKWFNLSATEAGTAHMLNLIWTDVAANAVVGTRGWASQKSPPNLVPRDEPGQGDALVPIYIFHRKIQYNYWFGIPAFVLCLYAVLLLLATIALSLKGSLRIRQLNKYIDHTSLGRNLTTLLYPNKCSQKLSKKDWDTHMGNILITIGGERPYAHGGEHSNADAVETLLPAESQSDK
jgi:hypothetical protein